VVFINFGANDCRYGEAGLAAFKETYNAVLDRIVNEVGSLVVIQTPNGILKLDEVRSPALPAYVETVRAIAAERDLLLVDHSARWAEVEPKGTMIFWLSDAVHPNEYGHRAMAHTLLHALELFDVESNVCTLQVP
jgi:lysophospholipase L1-like esterase